MNIATSIPDVHEKLLSDLDSADECNITPVSGDFCPPGGRSAANPRAKTRGKARLSRRAGVTRRDPALVSKTDPFSSPYDGLSDDLRLLSAQTAMGETGLAITIRFSRSKLSRITAPTRHNSIAGRLGRAIRQQIAGIEKAMGRAAHFYLVIELDRAGTIHAHAGIDIHPDMAGNMRRTLQRISGKLLPEFRPFAVKVRPFTHQENHNGIHGALGWASYLTKDLSTTARIIGQSPVYIPQHTRRIAREAWQSRQVEPALVRALQLEHSRLSRPAPYRRLPGQTYLEALEGPCTTKIPRGFRQRLRNRAAITNPQLRRDTGH